MKASPLLILLLAVALPSVLVSAQIEREFQADDGAALDRFGQALAVDGTRALVGSTGDDDFGRQSGSAYLIDLLSGEEIVKLNAPDSVERDAFGSSVSLKGNLAIIGVPDDDDNGDGSGAAWIFDLTQVHNEGYEPIKLTASDAAAGDNFGNAVATDGNHIIVGAWKDGDDGENQGAAYVFTTSGQEQHKLVANDGALFDQFGSALAIDNGTIVVGATFANAPGADSGAAYLFDANSGAQIAKLVAPDGSAGDTFGESVAIADGLLVIGASNYDDNDEDTLPGVGRAYLFDANTRNLVATLSPPTDERGARFGVSVSIGSRIAIGAFFADKNEIGAAGAVFVFQRNGEFQTKLQRSKAAPSDFLGQTVGVTNQLIVAGIPQADPNGSQSGSAIIFDLAPVSAPVLQISISGQDVHLNWISEAGKAYQIYSSVNLTDWTPLSGQISANSYLDRDAIKEARKFYRLRVLP